MDYDKLIERLKSAAGGPEGIKTCHEAALAITDLHADIARVTAERSAAIQDLNEVMVCEYLATLRCEWGKRNYTFFAVTTTERPTIKKQG